MGDAESGSAMIGGGVAGDAAAATIGARLARIARAQPQGLALLERDQELTFRELDDAADAIARHVAEVAATHATCVCLLFEDKLPAIQAIFGVGRSGLAYVLLDSADPAERLRFILEDCAPMLLLTQRGLLDRARELAPPGCPVVDIGALPHGRNGQPLPAVSPDALVYLCYTSGSTGRPKGVTQTHRNLLFFADAYAASMRIDGRDRHSLLYTLSFNAANMDIHGALLHGASLCVYDARRDGIASMAGWLDRERITILHTVPTVFRELCKRVATERTFPYLRAVDLGGESVFAADVALFVRHMPAHCVLINQLASTEVGLIAQNVIAHDAPATTTAIIAAGRCPPGVTLAIRRPDGSEAEIDEVGEIIVSSVHVSPGYWRRPLLDLAAFTEDPLWSGTRNYASGDLGRLDAQGNLHFLGRKGSGIKIRGYSVDLNEIEAALAACEGVVKSAVVVQRASLGDDSQHLCAFVVSDGVAGRTAQRMRRQLVTKVPAYMLPAEFAFVDALPLTPSGKIDRRALASAKAPREEPMSVVAPQDNDERLVASIFAHLLKLQGVGRDDDFFMLGGDSLMGTQLQAQLAQASGVRIAGLHLDATVAGIARAIAQARSAPGVGHDSVPVLFPLWRQGNCIPLFLVHGLHGQAFVSPHFMRLLGDDQPVWVFQARGLDGAQPPHATVEDMAQHYLAELRLQRPHGPYFLGALCAGAYIAALMARTLRAAGEVVLPLLLLDPPEGQPPRAYTAMGERRFVQLMQRRHALGRVATPPEGPAHMKKMADVAMGFEQALTRYDPLPYDGAAMMLCSQQRRGADRAWLQRVLRGPIERYEVGVSHEDALDPGNPLFAKVLLDCLSRIRAAADGGRLAAKS
ncbi:MAG: AMP-binding protein [Casimicrobiaceae bacterium]